MVINQKNDGANVLRLEVSERNDYPRQLVASEITMTSLLGRMKRYINYRKIMCIEIEENC